jgi:hypothetical protein
MYNYTIGYEVSELKDYSLSQIQVMIQSVQAGLSASEPRMTEAEIEAEARAIYDEANS